MLHPGEENRQITPLQVTVLKKRKDFLRVAAARSKWVSQSLILQMAPMPEKDVPHNSAIRVGYTASKKVGNAVKRVRAKRRLREVVRHCLADKGMAGHDYVLIARTATVDLPYDQLIRDFKWCLRRISASKPDSKTEKRRGQSQKKPDSQPSGKGE